MHFKGCFLKATCLARHKSIKSKHNETICHIFHHVQTSVYVLKHTVNSTALKNIIEYWKEKCTTGCIHHLTLSRNLLQKAETFLKRIGFQNTNFVTV